MLYAVREVTPTKSKVERLSVVSAMLEAGAVYLPTMAAWLQVLEDELFSFPEQRTTIKSTP